MLYRSLIAFTLVATDAVPLARPVGVLTLQTVAEMNPARTKAACMACVQEKFGFHGCMASGIYGGTVPGWGLGQIYTLRALRTPL